MKIWWLNKAKYILKESLKEFEKFLNGRTIKEALTNLEQEIHEKNKDNNMPMRINNNMEAESILRDKVRQLPENKVPIVIAGGVLIKRKKY